MMSLFLYRFPLTLLFLFRCRFRFRFRFLFPFPFLFRILASGFSGRPLKAVATVTSERLNLLTFLMVSHFCGIILVVGTVHVHAFYFSTSLPGCHCKTGQVKERIILKISTVMREVLSWFHNQQINWRKKEEKKLFYPSERVITTHTTCFSSLCPFHSWDRVQTRLSVQR